MCLPCQTLKTSLELWWLFHLSTSMIKSNNFERWKGALLAHCPRPSEGLGSGLHQVKEKPENFLRGYDTREIDVWGILRSIDHQNVNLTGSDGLLCYILILSSRCLSRYTLSIKRLRECVCVFVCLHMWALIFSVHSMNSLKYWVFFTLLKASGKWRKQYSSTLLYTKLELFSERNIQYVSVYSNTATLFYHNHMQKIHISKLQSNIINPCC